MKLDKFEGTDFKYENTFFDIPAQKISNKAFFGPQIIYFCSFYKILILDKFGVADFKYNNSDFKILAQNYPSKAILF